MNTFKLLSITFLLCLLGSMAMAQNRQVQGIVRDGDGVIPGVTVLEKDVPSNGVSTDIEGKFKITLKGKSNILVFRLLGYTNQEVKITNQLNITVKLESTTTDLKEVAVIGYGTQKKPTLTGAISQISGKELRDNPSVSLQNTLAGQVSGFSSQQRLGTPGADGATFYVRGVSSLSADNSVNQPLIIVDDVEFTYDQFSRLDANEVESVSVLKDASTTAIYGIKGANGVVLVTTRRGKAGPPAITLRSEYGLSQPTILPSYLDAYNTALLVNQSQIYDNTYSTSPISNFKPTYSDQDLALFLNGQDPYGHPNIDWKNELFKKFTPQQRYNLDVSGGTEKVNYFLSFGYVNQGGITKDYSTNTGVDNNYYYHRYNYRSNMDIKVNTGLSVRLDLSGNLGETNTPYVGNTGINGGTNSVFYDYSSYLSLAPYAYPIKNPDGSWGYSKTQAAGQYNGNNIIERMTLGGYNRNFENNMTLVGSATQDLKFITKGLTLKGTLSYGSSYVYGRGETRQSYPSYIYDPVAATYSPRDANIYKTDKFGLTYTPGSTQRQLTMQAILNYDRTFGNNHFSSVVLFNRSSLTRYVPSSGSYSTPTATSPDQNYNFIPANSQGLTGRLIYDFKQKYLVTLSGAYNGTDRFTAEKRFGFFPAVSAGWNVAEEPIIKQNLKFLDQLKLRASYGLVGSDRIGNNQSYSYLQTYTTANGSGGQVSFGPSPNALNGIAEGTLPNLNVTWDKQKELDLGIDYSFFNGKVYGLLDYFDYNRYDQLIQPFGGFVTAQSNIIGQTLPPANLGKSNNHGFEVELNYQNKIGKSFTYNIKSTYSYTHNTVIDKNEPNLPNSYQYQAGHTIGAVNTGTMFQWTGRYFKDVNDVNNTPHLAGARPGDLVFGDIGGPAGIPDGIINDYDKGYLGSSNLPERTYGLQLSLGYNGFSARVMFQAATNFTVSAYSEAIKPFTSNLLPIYLQSWTPALGDDAKYPALTQAAAVSDIGSNASTFYQRSGNYIRLKTAELGYTVPTKWTKMAHLQSAKIYVNGYNLLTWSKSYDLYSLDPELDPANAKYVQYPPSRIYNLGLSITF